MPICTFRANAPAIISIRTATEFAFSKETRQENASAQAANNAYYINENVYTLIVHTKTIAGLAFITFSLVCGGIGSGILKMPSDDNMAAIARLLSQQNDLLKKEKEETPNDSTL